jgi:hypothetical protein
MKAAGINFEFLNHRIHRHDHLVHRLSSVSPRSLRCFHTRNGGRCRKSRSGGFRGGLSRSMKTVNRLGLVFHGGNYVRQVHRFQHQPHISTRPQESQTRRTLPSDEDRHVTSSGDVARGHSSEGYVYRSFGSSLGYVPFFILPTSYGQLNRELLRLDAPDS